MSEVFETIQIMRKNLGPVTAYKYAVSQGFEGTEQEFAALMASYGTVAQEAEAAKDDAVDAKTAAEAAQAAAEAAASQAEGAIVVDDTLSIEGRAADAKAVGDVLSEVGVVHETSANLLNPADVIAGRITSSSYEVLHTGTYDTDYRTTGYIPVEAGKKYGFYVKHQTLGILGIAVQNIWVYKADKTGLQHLGSLAQDNTALSYVTAPANSAYMRASIAASIFNAYSIVMCAEADGINPPDDVVQYARSTYISGYAKTADLDAVESNVTELQGIIDDNFSPFWESLSGTRTDGKYITANGVVADIASYNIYTVPVTPGVAYKVTAAAYASNYFYGFFDASDNFISGSLASSGTGTKTIVDEDTTAPANAAKIVVVSNTASQKVKQVTKYVHKLAWENKKWACVGDSITEINVATSLHYFDYIVDKTGIAIFNMGSGGTGFVRGYNSSNAFYQRISSVPADSDLVTIFGSGNDCNIEAMSKFDGMTWAEALGTYSDATTDTICGCINATLDAYYDAMVTTPIGIIAPTPWKAYPTSKLTNNRMEDYAHALKQIADYRGVPFLDLYHNSNLRPDNEANRNACFYNGTSLDGNGDGVHPNELGHKIISSKIYEFIKTMLLF